MVNAGQDSPMVVDSNCPFCTIAQGHDLDVRKIYRDDHAVAFFPTEPAVLGHTLIVPCRHVPVIWELHDDEAEHLGLLISRLSKTIVETVAAEGLSVIQSNGEVATQTVNHVHFHIVPRWANDPIGSIWPPETSYSEHAKDYIWDALRDACKVLQL